MNDMWDLLDRETGEYLYSTVAGPEVWRAAGAPLRDNEVAFNVETGEVVYR